MTTERPPLACKRCGCPHVRWEQTNTGRWYLAVRFNLESADASARAYANVARKRPHRCNYCGECRLGEWVEPRSEPTPAWDR